MMLSTSSLICAFAILASLLSKHFDTVFEFGSAKKVQAPVKPIYTLSQETHLMVKQAKNIMFKQVKAILVVFATVIFLLRGYFLTKYFKWSFGVCIRYLRELRLLLTRKIAELPSLKGHGSESEREKQPDTLTFATAPTLDLSKSKSSGDTVHDTLEENDQESQDGDENLEEQSTFVQPSSMQHTHSAAELDSLSTAQKQFLNDSQSQDSHISQASQSGSCALEENSHDDNASERRKSFPQSMHQTNANEKLESRATQKQSSDSHIPSSIVGSSDCYSCEITSDSSGSDMKSNSAFLIDRSPPESSQSFDSTRAFSEETFQACFLDKECDEANLYVPEEDGSFAVSFPEKKTPKRVKDGNASKSIIDEDLLSSNHAANSLLLSDSDTSSSLPSSGFHTYKIATTVCSSIKESTNGSEGPSTQHSFLKVEEDMTVTTPTSTSSKQTSQDNVESDALDAIGKSTSGSKSPSPPHSLLEVEEDMTVTTPTSVSSKQTSQDNVESDALDATENSTSRSEGTSPQHSLLAVEENKSTGAPPTSVSSKQTSQDNIESDALEETIYDTIHYASEHEEGCLKVVLPVFEDDVSPSPQDQNPKYTTRSEQTTAKRLRHSKNIADARAEDAKDFEDVDASNDDDKWFVGHRQVTHRTSKERWQKMCELQKRAERNLEGKTGLRRLKTLSTQSWHDFCIMCKDYHKKGHHKPGVEIVEVHEGNIEESVPTKRHVSEQDAVETEEEDSWFGAHTRVTHQTSEKRMAKMHELQQTAQKNLKHSVLGHLRQLKTVSRHSWEDFCVKCEDYHDEDPQQCKPLTGRESESLSEKPKLSRYKRRKRKQ